MKFSPTQTKSYITVSMDTLYKAMKRGDLSYEENKSGRKIEFAELQRWHEANYGPLNDVEGKTSESIRSDIRPDTRQSSAESSGSAGEIALLARVQRLVIEF